MSEPSLPDGRGDSSSVPSLYVWAGGAEALARLTERFYERVRADALLGPVFERMSAAHPTHVAHFLGEVLGGPPRYSGERGGHPEMVRHHLGRHLTEAQRRRWTELLLDCADEVKLPEDPEFRSAFVAYVEWGSRLAVINSREGVSVDLEAPMPVWGWGVPGGPYRPG
ncbi:group II truncated hemoglobin [Corallococcus sicarius]|uniref:group II truncated hemoglobin n=1 Tax=Corallococcus sicarius TaxID=2316726 RepID=UPI001ABFBEE3|nr:group II truncated hemoglobin [Corallococcus sicarius]